MRHHSKKWEKALAFFISLWMAGGGVAEAAYPSEIYIDSDGSVCISDNLKNQPCVGTISVSGTTLNIGGIWLSPAPYYSPYSGYKIFAGNGDLDHGTGYTLNVNDATFDKVGGLELCGGQYYVSNMTLSNNQVVITDSKIIGNVSIYGGYIDSTGTVSDTAVTIAGTLDADGKPKIGFSGGIHSIYTASSGSTAPGDHVKFVNNTINLYGASAMEDVSLSAASWNGGTAPTHNNNELHLGGTKSGTAVNGIALSPWQGYNADGTAITNTLNKVSYFDKIVLHQVKWDAATPALKATKGFTNFGGGLDISDMTFAGTPAGTMTLLEGTADNFSALNLTYSTFPA